MQVIIGDTDITQFVQEKSYDIDSYDNYTSWTDADGMEHRGGYNPKISGSFEMVFIDGDVNNYANVLQLIENNSIDKRLTIKLTVNNLNNQLKQIICYYDLKTKSIRYVGNIAVKRIEMTIGER